MIEPIILDLGCGTCCRPGAIGLDFVQAPGVLHVCDLVKERWPIDDRSVDGIFSSHFFEHIDHAGAALHHVLSEIGRVCRDGAKIEIWTPHARGEGGFLPGHTSFLTETMWRHLCVLYRDCWRPTLRGAWQWHECRFCVSSTMVDRCTANGIDFVFALRHLWQVIEQFALFATYVEHPEVVNVIHPRITYSVNSRYENIHDITDQWVW